MVELIAECSTNSGGSIGLAKEFIWAYAEARADFVKFQFTRAHRLSQDDPQRSWFERAEFSLEQFAELRNECHLANVKFLLTAFHPDDVAAVASLGLKAIKIGSGEAGYYKMAEAIRKAGFLRVIASCGLKVPGNWFGGARVDLLRCVTRYPCPSACAIGNYDGMPFRGWSDHADGIEGCKIAIIGGATLIEKHVSLKQQARPKRSFEATVEEFKALRAFADEQPDAAIGRWNHA